MNRYDKTCKITTWLCAIAKNQWLVYLKRHPATLEYGEEIGKILNRSENWARVTYYRGKETLLKKLEKTGGSYE